MAAAPQKRQDVLNPWFNKHQLVPIYILLTIQPIIPPEAVLQASAVYVLAFLRNGGCPVGVGEYQSSDW